MANSRIGRDLLIVKVQKALELSTKKEAEDVVNKLITCIEDVLVENLDADKFSMKLNSLGKISIHHKAGIYRKIPFTGETKMTNAKRKVKFVSLGRLRQLEVVKDEPSGS
jgi:nucleoid DNA-binding protein